MSGKDDERKIRKRVRSSANSLQAHNTRMVFAMPLAIDRTAPPGIRPIMNIS